MITECTKSSNGKLLAAIIAMLMIVCAVAVVAPASDAVDTSADIALAEGIDEAAGITGDKTVASVEDLKKLAVITGEGEDATSTGIIVIGAAGATITLTGNVEDADVAFVLKGDLTIKSTDGQKYTLDISTNKAVYADGCTTIFAFNKTPVSLTFEDLTLSLDNKGTGNTNAIFNSNYYNFADGGVSATVSFIDTVATITQSGSSAVSGSAWIGVSDGEKAQSSLVIDDSTLDIESTGGFQDTRITASGTSAITMTDVAVGLVVADGSVLDGLTYTVESSDTQGIAFKGQSTLKNTTIAIESANTSSNNDRAYAMLYDGAEVTMDASSTIKAQSVKVAGNDDWTGQVLSSVSAMPKITGGTIEGATFMDTTGSAADANPASYTLSGVTLKGTSSIADGATVSVPTGSTVTIPAESTFTVADGATLYNGGNVNAKAGTLNLEGNLIASPTSTTSGVNWDADKMTVYNGAAIEDKDGKTVIPEEYKSYAESQEVTTFPELVDAISSGIEKITVEVTGTFDLNSIEIPYGTVVTIKAPASGASVTGADPAFEKFLNVPAGETVTISGEMIVEGCVTVAEGATLIVEDTLTANQMQIDGTLENSGVITVNGAADTNSAMYSIYVTAEGTIENSGDMYLGAAAVVYGMFENSGAVGVVDGATGVEITGATGTFNNLSGGVVGFPVNTGTVTGVSYDVTMTTDITQSTTFGSLQNVIVPEGAVLTIQRTATLEINGTLTVLGTLNVEGQLVVKSAAGAQLVVDGTVNVNTTGNNQGKIVIGDASESGIATVNGTVNVTDGSAVEVAANSALVIDGTMTFQAGTTLTSGQQAPVAALEEIGDKKAEPAQGIVVSAGATLTLNGDLIDTVAIRNYGEITVDNSASDAETPGSLKVLMGSADATVTLTSFRLEGTNSFSVSDSGLIFKDRTRTADAIAVTDINTVEFKAGTQAVILNGGVVFTESVTSKTTNSTTTYTNKLNVDGSVSAAFTDRNSTENVTVAECADMNVDGDKAVTVTGALTLGANVEMNNAGNLEVSGTVTNTATGTQIIQNTGEITVTGLITASKEIAGTGVINAAKYTITSGTPAVTTYNYSTLEAAVPAVADAANTATKTILVMGEITVKQDLDVPAGITINHAKDAKLTIDRDATVTMQAGSKMTSAKEQVVVDGTLTFNDKTNDATTKTVSDVTVEDEAKNGYRTYTNIYSALAEATDGQTVTVTKDTGLVVIDENLTVPAGVTLVVPSRAVSLYLEDGVTLTVDGTLKTDLAIFAEHTFGTTATNVEDATGVTAKQSSAIVVNGTLQVAEEIGFAYGNNSGTVTTVADGYTGVSIADDAPIYGAYYSVDGYTVVSTLAIASGNTDIIGAVVVNGPVNAGDVTFTGTDEFTSIVIGNNATVKDMNGKDVVTVLTVGSLTLVGTDVATTYGALNGDIVVGDARLTVSNVKNLTVTDDEEDGMVVSGNVSVIGDNGGKVTLAAGTATATLNSSNGTVEFDVAAGATLVSDGANLYKLTVDGTVSVASGKNLTAATVVVEGNGTLSVTASTATSAAGSAQITNLFLGIDNGDYKIGDKLDTAAEGTATVSGPVSGINNAYVLNGAVIDESNLEGMDSTAFNVNGQVWFTAYVSAASSVENAVLAGWSETADGEAETVTIDNKVVAKTEFAIGEAENLYAVIEYEIYHIVLKANEAVDDVFINGNLMSKGLVMDSTGMYYAYTMDIAAGSYTVSYTLANGYSGEGVLTVNGTAQSGLTFSVSGTPAIGQSYITYNMELSGFEKTGYVPESPDTGSDDSGMGITDYLLIVLVVLIIVMAIIVAMRLMRS